MDRIVVREYPRCGLLGDDFIRPNNHATSSIRRDIAIFNSLIVMPSKTCHDFVTPCQRRTYEYHRARVKSATSVVDVVPPKVRPHIKYDAKKRQLESERQEKIVRENFILLKKLQAIMYKK